MKIKILLVFGLLLCLPFTTQAVWEKDIKYGVVKNEEVKVLQQFLKDQGLYKGSISGNFFAVTRNAVIAFQKKQKIKPYNGKFAGATREKALELYNVQLRNMFMPAVPASPPVKLTTPSPVPTPAPASSSSGSSSSSSFGSGGSPSGGSPSSPSPSVDPSYGYQN